MTTPFHFNEIGPSIRVKRQSMRWSQRRLAAEAGIPVSQLAALERGELGDIPIVRLQRLLNVLGADFSISPYNRGRPTLWDLKYEELLEERRGLLPVDWIDWLHVPRP